MIDWIPVNGSSMISAEAYDPETERIYLRFHDGPEWWYDACPPPVWQEFTAPWRLRTWVRRVAALSSIGGRGTMLELGRCPGHGLPRSKKSKLQLGIST